MFKDLDFLNLFFAGCMFICLLAFIGGVFIYNKEIGAFIELIKWFGLPLGVGVAAVAKAINKG